MAGRPPAQKHKEVITRTFTGLACLINEAAGQGPIENLLPQEMHPRNKEKLGAASAYNARKIMLLDAEQVNHLADKIKTERVGSCLVEPDAIRKRIKLADGSYAATRPRGVELSSEYRYGLFSPPSDKPKYTPSWERSHIILAKAEIFPDTSEHEVSHLCHNPFCLDPTHLLWELHPSNEAREECRFTRKLKCPCCDHTFSLCKHNPKCIPV